MRREAKFSPGEFFPGDEYSSHLRTRENQNIFGVEYTLLRFSMDTNMKYFILVETRRGHEQEGK